MKTLNLFFMENWSKVSAIERTLRYHFLHDGINFRMITYSDVRKPMYLADGVTPLAYR